MKHYSRIKAIVGILVCLIFILLRNYAFAFAQQTQAIVSPSEASIVGGELAERGEFPWQAMLFNPSGSLVCGGSLIHPNWILTAAHCLDGSGITNVTVGGYDTTRAGEADRQNFAVKRVIIHPNFKAATLSNDLGLIELDGTAVANASTQIISLLMTGEESLAQPGIMATVSGWGTNGQSGWMTAVLNKVSLPLVAQETCTEVYGGLLRNTMACAGFPEGGKDSCRGDSGGPLVVPDGDGGWKLFGIVSWGKYPCAQAGYYGVYTRVTNFYDWVIENIGEIKLLPAPTAQPTVTAQPTISPTPQVIATPVPTAPSTLDNKDSSFVFLPIVSR